MIDFKSENYLANVPYRRQATAPDYIRGFTDGCQFSNEISPGAGPQAMAAYAEALRNSEEREDEVLSIAYGIMGALLTVIVVLDKIDIEKSLKFYQLREDIQTVFGATFELQVKASQGRTVLEMLPPGFIPDK